MEISELKYWVAFNRVSGVGRARMALLEGAFGSLGDAWRAGPELLRRAGLNDSTARRIASAKSEVDPDDEMERVLRAGVRALTWRDEDYPPRLKQIYDKPPVLYVKGDILPRDERSVAVVGTRKPSAYGREAARKLTAEIAAGGVTIVSGLARGVDGVAHGAALDAGARTIAVLGSGVDVIYPREHAALAERIAENGAVVSEHPVGARPDAQNFPRRNRIISGATLGTLVIEAPEGSGALLTARHALEQNREVFAVPGSILSPSSSGANCLIRDSAAKLVTRGADVMVELNLTVVERQMELVDSVDEEIPPVANAKIMGRRSRRRSVPSQMNLAAFFPEDEAQAAVLKYVTFDPIHIDEITRNSALAASTVSGALTMMELRGLVRQVGGMNYVRLSEAPADYAAGGA